MSDVSNNFFGWELLYSSLSNSLNKKTDVIIALVHFLLIKRKFRCVSLGESKTLAEGETGSEMLPNGWSEDDKYAIRYVHNKTIYIVMGNTIEDSFLMNILSVAANKVSNIALVPDGLVKKLNGTLDDIMPEAALLAQRLDQELINPVFSGSSKDCSSQTEVKKPANNPLQIGQPRYPRMPGQFYGEGFEPRPFGFPDVGRSDLDPLGSFGSGNLLQFPPRSLPRGMPRFDPFNTLDPEIPNRPNPDHLRPPTFGNFDVI